MLPTAGPGGYGTQSYGSGPAMLPTWSGGGPGGGGYGYGGFSSGGFYGDDTFADEAAAGSYGAHQFGAVKAIHKKNLKPPVGPTHLSHKKMF